MQKSRNEFLKFDRKCNGPAMKKRQARPKASNTISNFLIERVLKKQKHATLPQEKALTSETSGNKSYFQHFSLSCTTMR